MRNSQRVTAAALLVAACGALAVVALGARSQQPGVVDLRTQANVRIAGPGPSAWAGSSVSDAGDVNGDGRPDVLVGSVLASTNQRAFAGSAYVVFGPASSSIDLAALGSSGFRILGAKGSDPFSDDVSGAGDFAGLSVSAAGDVNGDGRGDVLVGAPGADNNGHLDSGSAYVVFGTASTTTVDLAALGGAGFRIDGGAEDDFAGVSVSDLGDVDGDGRADVLVGALGADNNGRPDSGSAYVVFGRTSTTTIDLAALGDAGFRIDGAAVRDLAGGNLSNAGDVNGDGRVDVLVGADVEDREDGRPELGSAYVVFGSPSSTTIDLAALGGSGFRIDGAASEDSAGLSLSGAGDVNRDGRADVLVGAPATDTRSRPYSGAAFVVFGKASATPVDLRALGTGGFRIHGADREDLAGASVSAAGDVDGDGRGDVLVGAPGADNNGRLDSGSAYVVFGKSSTSPVDLVAPGALGFRIDGVDAGDRAGSSVSGAGDLNGDGRADALVGAPGVDRNGNEESGSAYVVFGRRPDMTRPRLAVSAASPQRALRQGRILVRASCNEPCTLSAQGTISIVGSSARIPLRSAGVTGATTAPRTLALELTPAAGKRLSGFLAQGRVARASLRVRATDRAGNVRTATRTVAVRR